MKQVRCLVIDDEPLAIDIIQNYLDRIDDTIVTRCENAVEALRLLREEKFDIIFLDIEMPMLTGLEFLKSLTNPPAIIITTAYRDYAVEGFDFEVVDFLLKPISFGRFMKGFERALKTTKNEEVETDAEQSLFIRSDRSHIKLRVADILYIESMKDYVKVKTINQDYITYQTLTAISEALPGDKFLRIHRSFTIAIQKVTKIKAGYVEIEGEDIPISRDLRASVVKRIMDENDRLK